MPYGMYISAEGAHAQSKRLETLSNNLANVDTPGFKRDLTLFQARHAEEINQGTDYPGSRGVNDIGGGVWVRETKTDFAPGLMKRTGNETDFAIDGDAFFLVRKDGNDFLTRAGNFQVSPTGVLETPDHYPVLSETGAPITINPALGPWHLTEFGGISQAGVVTNLALVRPQSMGDLVKSGQTLFAPLAPPQAIAPAERRVHAGYLEQSGVKPTVEMMELIEASRAFEANTKMISNQDQMIGTLVNRVLKSPQ